VSCGGFLSGIQCYCICGGFSRIQCTCACEVDPNRYSALVHLRWILRDYSALVSIDFSEKNCLALFFFFFSQFLPRPPPICSSNLLLLLIFFFSRPTNSSSNSPPSGCNEVRLLTSCPYAPINPSFSPECEGGRIPEKKGG